MGGKSERFIMRLDANTLAAWKVEAVKSDISVAALIILRMEAGPAVAKAKVDELEVDIARLDASLACVTELEQQVAWFASKEIGWEAQSRASAEIIAQQVSEIAELKEALANQPDRGLAASFREAIDRFNSKKMSGADSLLPPSLPSVLAAPAAPTGSLLKTKGKKE